MALVTLIQANGERIPMERWAYDGIRVGTVTDPMLVGFVLRAVEIRDGFGWPVSGDLARARAEAEATRKEGR